MALDKPDYKSGDTLNVAVTARTAGRLTINVFTDRLVATQSQDVKAGTARVSLTVGRDWGAGAYMVATLRRPLDAPAFGVEDFDFTVQRRAEASRLNFDDELFALARVEAIVVGKYRVLSIGF